MSNNITIPVPQAKYELLKDDTKARLVSNRKLCLLATLVILTVAFIGFIILVINLEYFINEFKLPADYQAQEVPSHWLQRAIKYNSFDKDTISKNLPDHLKTKNHYKSLPEYKLVCYYSVPSPTSTNKVNVLKSNEIDPNLCTHINVGFMCIENNSIVITSMANETLQNIVDLKKLNKNLKVLVSIGGGGDDAGFSKMVLNHQNRKTFLRSAVSIIKEYKLDGIDLDWEFPNEHQNGDKKQRMHFTQLLYEIREEIERHTKKHKFLLSVAVAAPSTLVDNSYDVAYINRYVDYINLMSYDYHFFTKLTPFTGLNSPLYSHTKESGYMKTLNINSSAYYWHENGMDKSKIIVGLPTYGHSFQLTNPLNHGLTAPSNGYGKTGSIGFVDYTDICWFLSYYKVNAIFDMDTKSPYAFKGTEWVSYDNMESLSYKTEFIKENNFGGAMILSLNTDDFSGKCKGSGSKSEDNFPLTKKVKNVLFDDQL